MPRLTSERADARRRQILDAAVACFARSGFHGTTMQDICHQAGLSAGSVYCWFAGKKEIVEAVAEQRHAREVELIQAALAAGDPATVLHRFVDAYFDWLRNPEERSRHHIGVQVWAEALHNPRLRRTIDEGIGQRAVAYDFVHAAQAAGALPSVVDADALTRVMLALIQGFILQQAWEPDVDIDGYRQVVKLFVDSLSAVRGG